jgi:hypothetical protein
MAGSLDPTHHRPKRPQLPKLLSQAGTQGGSVPSAGIAGHAEDPFPLSAPDTAGAPTLLESDSASEHSWAKVNVGTPLESWHHKEIQDVTNAALPAKPHQIRSQQMLIR